MYSRSIALLVFLFTSTAGFSQEQRLSDQNAIGWFVYTGAFKISPRLAIHTEYQWRRVNGIKNRQQGLFRTGVNFVLRKEISLSAGYAFAETSPYGDYPNTSAFPEHRIFEQAMINNPLGGVSLSHRFTLEQRFIGKVSFKNAVKNIDYVFLNRVRYRLKAEIPLNKRSADKNLWSINLQDEVFINGGKNTGTNIFDQNRAAILLGCKTGTVLKIEAGYLSQVLQQGKRINDKPVFQYNNGFMIAAHFTIDLTK